MTADCLPVLLANREGTVVAAVHAGWKSLAAGIIGKTIRVMRERAPESTGFVAWLAPRIGPEAFEVGPDVREAMLAGLPEADRAFTQGEGDRLMCDLALLEKWRSPPRRFSPRTTSSTAASPPIPASAPLLQLPP